MDTPNLDLITLFLGYVITADGAVHNTELAVFNELLGLHALSGEARQSLAEILADDGDKVPVETVLQRLAAADLATQEQALIAALAITYGDGFLDPFEERLIELFLERTGFPREQYLTLKEQAAGATRTETPETSHQLTALLSSVLRPLVMQLANAGPRAGRERLERLGNRLLLAGPEYGRAIDRCAQVAAEDFAVAEVYLKRGNEQVIQLSRAIAEHMRGIVQRPELQEINVRDTLVRLRDTINERLVARVERQRESLVKRRRALSYYTISFIGRTKAGKSTLHAVITGEGSDAIGAGLQRTTRFNRVYTWNQLRIIDTPGIGAPGGQSDEAIAESVVDESDVICYVVTNDSIQEAEFRFLASIRERGKPVIILLNVKENIADERRLRLYMKNPQRWHARDDEQSLQGHLDRIRRYAQTFYGNALMPIFPVQLLAARLSREEAHQAYASTLYSSSRLQDFLDALRVGLIEEGPLRRSQTMLDGAIHTLAATRADLAELAAPLRELRQKLGQERERVIHELDRGATRASAELRQSIGSAFNGLKEVAAEFAQRHYEDSERAAQKAWEAELQRRRFVKRLQDEIEAAYHRYFEGVRSFLDEVSADLGAFADLKVGGFAPETSPTGIDLRMAASIGSIVAGIGGTAVGLLALAGVAVGPVGWICAAAAVGFGFLGSLLESKAEKRQKAVARLHSSLIAGIDRQKAQTAAQVEDGLKKTRRDVERRVLAYFTALTAALDGVLAVLVRAERSLDADCNALNHAFATRILGFALAEAEGKVPPLIEVVAVRRDMGASFTITTPHRISQARAERVSAILQQPVAIVQPVTTKARSS